MRCRYIRALRADTHPGRGVRARYFKYEVDLVETTGYSGFDEVGPAFGIHGFDNLFYVAYKYSGGEFRLWQVVDGQRPAVRTTGAYTLVSGKSYTVRVEIAKGGPFGSEDQLTLTVVNNTDVTETVVINGYNLS